MKFTKTIERPATTEEVLDHYTCDLCGRKTDNSNYWPSTLEVERSPWYLGVDNNLRRTNIEMEIGDSYPEGSSGDRTEFDICTDCFTTKLIPWFRSQGAKPRVEEWDC